MAAGMWIGAAAALLGAAPAVPTVMTGEMVLPRAQAGFILHEAETREGSGSYEYRLKGEAPDGWTRLIILTRALHPHTVRGDMLANASATAAITAAGMAAALQLSCRAASVKLTPDTPPQGRASATLRVRCPADTVTHDPVITRVRTITGPEAMHMVLASVRGRISLEDEKWADRVIADLTICGANDVEGRCGARSRVIGGAL